MQSHVNLSRIVRAAALFGVQDLLVAGSGKVDREIALGAEEHVRIKAVRSLLHPLLRFRSKGYHIVGLEQTEVSQPLYDFAFPATSPTVLVCGHERHGVTDDILAVCDSIVEIPTFGTHLGSHNASTACMIAMYEYVRQRTGPGASVCTTITYGQRGTNSE